MKKAARRTAKAQGKVAAKKRAVKRAVRRKVVKRAVKRAGAKRVAKRAVRKAVRGRARVAKRASLALVKRPKVAKAKPSRPARGRGKPLEPFAAAKAGASAKDLALFEFADTAEEVWASLERRGLNAHMTTEDVTSLSSY